jgi:Zn-finger nucleic acid-binding protein
MAKCKHCSAPLPSSSIICEYCGVRNDIELQPKINRGLPKSKRMCPDCMVYLDSIDIGENDRFIIEKCERCYGLFFDINELETLLKQSVESTYWINPKKLHSLQQHPLHKDTVLYRKCPECSKIMQRKNYMNKSGVIMDVCMEHGIWLDAGELKQIQEWIALGGKQVSEEMAKTEEEAKSKKVDMTHYNHNKNSYDRSYDPVYDSNTTEKGEIIADALYILSRLFGH